MGVCNSTLIENKTDGIYSYIDIRAEQIHKELNEVYVIITTPNCTFEERYEKVKRYYKKYRFLINPYFPHMFNFVRDCYGIEYFIFIATIGMYAIDIVMYWDLKDWIVLNTGCQYRVYNRGGSSNIQNNVSKRLGPTVADDKVLFETRKRLVDDIRNKQDFTYNDYTIVDFRNKPKIRIVEPIDKSVINGEVPLKVELEHWHKKGFHVYVNGKEQIYVDKPKDVLLRLPKRGWNRITVQLADPRFANVRDEVEVMYDPSISDAHKNIDSVSTSGCIIHGGDGEEFTFDDRSDYSYNTETTPLSFTNYSKDQEYSCSRKHKRHMAM
jgi:hypothetical protein